MKVTKHSDDFYVFEHLPSAALRALKFSVPAGKKTQIKGKWYVAAEYHEYLVNVASQATNVDLAVTDEYIGLEGGARTLYLTEDAPKFVASAVWKALAKKYHPDSPEGDSDLFQQFKKVYDARMKD